jgi:hypothetical protein
MSFDGQSTRNGKRLPKQSRVRVRVSKKDLLIRAARVIHGDTAQRPEEKRRMPTFTIEKGNHTRMLRASRPGVGSSQGASALVYRQCYHFAASEPLKGDLPKRVTQALRNQKPVVFLPASDLAMLLCFDLLSTYFPPTFGPTLALHLHTRECFARERRRRCLIAWQCYDFAGLAGVGCES